MLRSLFTLVLIGLLALGAYVFVVTRNLPSVDAVLEDGINPTQWTQVFAADGTPILSFGKFRHEKVRLDDVSPHFIDSLIATEDRRFYLHTGVDPIAIARAIASDLSHQRIREGGSTLTQQLARNIFLSSERSFSRKVREAVLALELERKLTKDQILELYINNIYFGEGAYGIKAASEIYFNKPPSQLSVSEAALLAGLPQAPSGYSPFQNMEGARKRRDEVLENLWETGKISQDELEGYKSHSIQLNPGGQSLASSNRAPFFNRYVMDQVMRYFNLDEQSFWQSGLKIYTTLDLQAQRLAEAALLNQSRAYGRTGRNQQASLVSIEPQTGAILAYVGGKNYQQSQFDRVTQAVRSPGSLFKVFTYTTAIDRGYEPTRVYLDEPIRIGDWQPNNYDKAHHGYMTLARALITSNNVIAVKVIHELGAESVAHMARQMGVRSPLQPYLGLTLGGSGVNLLEMTSAFGVLANQGVRVEPYAIAKILDDGGREIYREHPVKTDVLNRTTVDTMVKMMSGVVERGTGRAAIIGRPTAGKTGTSDDYRDAWFIGFTPNVVTGVWVGNDNNSPMPGMTGGSLPAVIWRTFMRGYLSGRPARDFDLAYSKPLAEADYTTFDLKNLSEQEAENGLGVNEFQEGELQADPSLEGGDSLFGDGLDPNAAPAGQEGAYPPEEAPARNNGVPALPKNPAPVGPPYSQPDGQPGPQPMPGYEANPGSGVRPMPRSGYGVIPLPDRRHLQPRRIEPTESQSARNTAAPGVIPVPVGDSHESDR